MGPSCMKVCRLGSPDGPYPLACGAVEPVCRFGGVQLGALAQRSAYLGSAGSITGSREGPHKPPAPITPRGRRAWVHCRLAGHRYRPRCRTDAPCCQNDQGSESRCIGPEPVRRQFGGFRSSLSQVQSACFAFAHSDTDAVLRSLPLWRSRESAKAPSQPRPHRARTPQRARS